MCHVEDKYRFWNGFLRVSSNPESQWSPKSTRSFPLTSKSSSSFLRRCVPTKRKSDRSTLSSRDYSPRGNPRWKFCKDSWFEWFCCFRPFPCTSSPPIRCQNSSHCFMIQSLCFWPQNYHRSYVYLSFCRSNRKADASWLPTRWGKPGPSTKSECPKK